MHPVFTVWAISPGTVSPVLQVPSCRAVLAKLPDHHFAALRDSAQVRMSVAGYLSHFAVHRAPPVHEGCLLYAVVVAQALGQDNVTDKTCGQEDGLSSGCVGWWVVGRIMRPSNKCQHQISPLQAHHCDLHRHCLTKHSSFQRTAE